MAPPRPHLPASLLPLRRHVATCAPSPRPRPLRYLPPAACCRPAASSDPHGSPCGCHAKQVALTNFSTVTSSQVRAPRPCGWRRRSRGSRLAATSTRSTRTRRHRTSACWRSGCTCHRTEPIAALSTARGNGRGSSHCVDGRAARRARVGARAAAAAAAAAARRLIVGAAVAVARAVRVAPATHDPNIG
jgi:hypothetical protein